MTHGNRSEDIRERLDRLERRFKYKNSRMAVFLVLSGFVLGTALSCMQTTTDTIEARKIVLKDPSGHTLAVLGVDNKWDGIESKEYHAGIEFRDEKGDKKMNLFGTGLFLHEGDQHSHLDFTGLAIEDKKTHILLNKYLFSFATGEGSATLMPHETGINLTINNSEDNEIGVVADADAASMYVASPKWEAD